MKELKTGSLRDIQKFLFIAAFVSIAELQKQPMCLPMDE
jgi:hypothetical protein